MGNGGGRRRRAEKKLRRQPATLSFEHLEDRRVMAVIINEFLADNADGIEDAAGHRHDWLELRNTGAVAENIAGWYLTDSSSNLTKFQIPANGALSTLDPGEILLVYASGNNGEEGWQGSELHANFQLSQEPGYLGLVRANGTTVEHEFNLYPQQGADVSYGSGIGIGSTTTETLLGDGVDGIAGDGSPIKFRPFSGPNAAVDDHWTEIDYVATAGAGWLDRTNGVGAGYATPWQDSTASMGSSPNISAYVRMPFTVTNKAQLTSMNLELRVDNGYILFLNGREVKRERVHTDLKMGNDWELNARQNIANATMLANPAVIDLTPWLSTIEEGNNVLAIYAANHTSDATDFLVHANLTAQRANGPATTSYMVTPTPGAPNGAGYAGIIDDTNFSHDRGFYSAPFNLTISTVEPGTTIRYTTDGSIPTLTNGTTYTGPIGISSALAYAGAGVVTVRAAAFKSGFFSSNVDTQSYIFLDQVLTQDGVGVPTHSTWGHSGPDWSMNPAIVAARGAENLKADLQSLPTMSLTMDWRELFGDGTTLDGHGIYTQNETWRDRSDERAASLEYFTADASEEFQIDAAVEIQGHSSANRWNQDKLSFQVKFKQPYATKLESEALFGNSVADGENAATEFDTLILDAQHNYTFTHANTAVQSNFATYIHDQTVADLSNAVGVPAAHGRWVHLYINGMYWGVYNAHERPDDSFAEEYLGGDSDDYYVVKGFDGSGMTHGGSHPAYLQVDGGLSAEAAYNGVGGLLDEVNDNMAILAEYQQVEQMLDIDSFIDYMVTLFYAGNYDWSKNNWFATLNHVDPNGKWRFHSWDQEHAFPTDQNGGPTGSNPIQNYSHPLAIANDFNNHQFGPTGIHHKLMVSPEYRLRFSDRVQELMRNDGVLTPANAQAVWQARVDEISAAMNAEAARWGDNRGASKDWNTWNTNVNYTSTHFFFANGPYASRTDTVIDIFNATSASGVGKTDWLVNLDAPTFNQYGGEVASGFDLTLANPNGAGTIWYTLDGSDPRASNGAVSGSAIAYTGTIDISEGTRVRARVLDTAQSGTANDWSAEVNKTFTLAESFPLRIVELHYNPSGSEEVTEFIELLNYGDETISLNGIQIGGFANTPYSFQSGQTLAAGQRIVVARNPTDFTAAYGGGINLATGPGYAEQNLSNGGELVTLLGPVGELLQSFTFGDSGAAGWPDSPDGDGPSLEYIGPLTGTEDPTQTSPLDPFDNPANWRASTEDGGSPGTDGASLPDDADFNDDGEISGLDFLAWQRNFSIPSGASFEQGDANHDGAVNSADLAIWETQYNTPPPMAAALAASSAPINVGPQLAALAAVQAGYGATDPASRDMALEEAQIDEMFLAATVSAPADLAVRRASPRDEALESVVARDSADDSVADALGAALEESLL